MIVKYGVDVLMELRPDIIILAGDRYETFSMGITAFYLNIPIAHLFIVLNYNTTLDDIEGWDSLSNIILILEIEKEFDIKFKLEEIQSYKNIGGVCDNILTRIRD